MNVLSNFLEQTKIETIAVPLGKVVGFPATTSIEEALKILAENDILSAPVFDPETKEYIGFVDVMDILRAIIGLYSEASDTSEIAWSKWATDINSLSLRGIRFAIKPVKNVVDLSKIDPYLPVSKSGTLYQLMEEVFSKGIHRAPLYDDIAMKAPVALITQSDVINAISKVVPSSSIGIKTVEELSLGTRYPIQMSIDALAIQAFYLMYFHKVSAVAIVGKTGNLVANLSASDIKGLKHDNFSRLLLPVMEFLKGTTSKKCAPITCRLFSSIETVILKLSLFRIHRLWIVDEKENPIGVISLTDIMKLLTSQ